MPLASPPLARTSRVTPNCHQGDKLVSFATRLTEPVHCLYPPLQQMWRIAQICYRHEGAECTTHCIAQYDRVIEQTRLCSRRATDPWPIYRSGQVKGVAINLMQVALKLRI